MDPLALGLVLTGSVFHLGWNALTKKAADRLAFLWMVLAPQAALGAALVTLEWRAGGMTPRGWTCMLVSGVVHAVYFWALAGAYGKANLSFVYPYCRGIGAALTIVGGVLLLGEMPSALGWFGIGLTLLATFLEPLANWKKGGAIERDAVLWTVGTGVCIAGYLLIDKVGVAVVRPLPYLTGFVCVSAILLTPMVLPNGRVAAEAAKTGWPVAFGAALLGAAYLVILFAMKIAPVSYVVAARATGILLSGVVGWLAFQERVAPVRWAAIGLIALGVMCIGLA